jgi:peptidoglycan/LPS O-acetylase OafA/YrhL
MNTASALSLAGDSAPAPSAHPAHLPYRPDIDGLRAIAVLSVVLFHAFPGKLRGGFAGVDIFFVISGFLIGSILIGGMQRGDFSFADFYARRVRRIFPALTLVLASCLAFGWFGLFADEFRALGKHVIGGAGFLSNIYLWKEVGYFDTAAETKPLLHLWSLAIEEQFYIVWPLLLLLALKRRWPLWSMAAVLGAASFLVNIAGVQHFPEATFYSLASRAWELLAGVLLAYASVNGISFTLNVQRGGKAQVLTPGSPRGRDLQSCAGLGLIVLALALLQRGPGFPGWWALLPVLGALLLISAGPQAWVNRRILSQRLLVGVGLISYPLYLWHWPLLSFAQIVEGGIPARPVKLAAVGAAFLLAWLTWLLVERPLRGTRFGRAKVAALAGLMTVLAGVGYFVKSHGGLPERPSIVANSLQQKDLVLVEDVANAKACKQRYGFDSLYEYCLMDDPTREPTVVLLGDSHAYHINAGQMQYWRSKGENFLYLGTRVPFIGIPTAGDSYQEATPQMLALALKLPDVKTVLFSTALSLHQPEAEKALLVPAFRETVRTFLAAGKRVIYVADTPKLDFEPRNCIRRGAVPASNTRQDCSLPRATYDATLRQNADFGPVLKEFPAVQVFDIAPMLCDAQRCRVMVDDALMYRDTHHLSYRGDLAAGAAFARWDQEQARR